MVEKIRKIKYSRLSPQEKILIMMREERDKCKEEQNLYLIGHYKYLINSMYGSFR